MTPPSWTFRAFRTTARPRRRQWSRSLRAAGVGLTGVTAVSYATLQSPSLADSVPAIPDPSQFPRIPSRQEQLSALTAGGKFDVLVIGGGASGAGCALDAASRGLKVGLVERDDFASGTSSRSTKLVHGGVRYLEKAFRVGLRILQLM
jgi:glycerol-3-phosphate dehydrogenase